MTEWRWLRPLDYSFICKVYCYIRAQSIANMIINQVPNLIWLWKFYSTWPHILHQQSSSRRNHAYWVHIYPLVFTRRTNQHTKPHSELYSSKITIKLNSISGRFVLNIPLSNKLQKQQMVRCCIVLNIPSEMFSFRHNSLFSLPTAFGSQPVYQKAFFFWYHRRCFG